MKNFRLNKKGFTLIELMIVIAIIGVLAAVAIPNFISYRNKSYCSATESTARNVGAAVAEYYAVPTRTVNAPSTSDINFSTTAIRIYDVQINYITATGGISITAQDPQSRCPLDYRNASPNWDVSTAFVYSYNMD